MNSEILTLIRTMLEGNEGKGITPEMIDMIMMIINFNMKNSKTFDNTFITKKEFYQQMNNHHKFMMKTFPERIKSLPIKEDI
ncbi:MAG: hypothetical protein RR436_02700 [Clostridia bacterium]